MDASIENPPLAMPKKGDKPSYLRGEKDRCRMVSTHGQDHNSTSWIPDFIKQHNLLHGDIIITDAPHGVETALTHYWLVDGSNGNITGAISISGNIITTVRRGFADQIMNPPLFYHNCHVRFEMELRDMSPSTMWAAAGGHPVPTDCQIKFRTGIHPVFIVYSKDNVMEHCTPFKEYLDYLIMLRHYILNI